MTEFDSYAKAVDSLIAKVGKNIVIGIPLGLGKPIGFINALYERVESDPSLNLTIVTGLTLARPVFKSSLEKNFGEPILERLIKDYEDPLYEIARVRQKVPANIRIIEFFLSPGKFLHNTYVQQNYISSKYTNVADDTMHHGINVIAQQVARRGDEYSLSSNTDLFKDMLDLYQARFGSLDKLAVIADVNNNMPYMLNDAVIPASTFSHIIDTKKYRALFALPRDEVTAQDHMIGLYSSTIIKDNGCLQVGIGTLSTSLASALIERHQENDKYQAMMRELNVPERYKQLIAEEGGLDIFDKGIYASTEMVSDEYIHLLNAGIIKKRVYDHLGLQLLLNKGEISEEVSSQLFDKLIENGVISKELTADDINFLKTFGIFKANAQYNGPSSVKECLGTRLTTGKLIHGGFFMGSNLLYDGLRNLPPEIAAQVDMTRISRTNSILWSRKLAIAQRIHARFVNSAMIITLSGALVSDGLANLQEVSGVGGQFDFVNMAQELDDARSIIICRSTRMVGSDTKSNVLWTYPNMTIPRYLRDMVITEYGIADCRSKTDADVIKELLNITDSRYQEKLMKQAKTYGKLAKDYHIPEQYRANYPEKINTFIQRQRSKGLCKPYPFGSDLTPEEEILKTALLQMKSYSKFAVIKNLAASLFIKNNEQLQPYFARMKLQNTQSFKDKIYKNLLKYALT